MIISFYKFWYSHYYKVYNVMIYDSSIGSFKLRKLNRKDVFEDKQDFMINLIACAAVVIFFLFTYIHLYFFIKLIFGIDIFPFFSKGIIALALVFAVFLIDTLLFKVLKFKRANYFLAKYRLTKSEQNRVKWSYILLTIGTFLIALIRV